MRKLLLFAVLLAACSRAPHAEKKGGDTEKTAAKHDEGPAHRGKDPCGAVDLDGQKILLDCADEGYGHVAGASVAPFRHHLKDDAPEIEEDAKKPKKLPKHVDHREDGTEGPIRDQGPVGACTAFSLAAAIDHALKREEDEADPVSVMHLWARYATPSMADAVKYNRDKPISVEDKWPYDAEDACSWLDPEFCRKGCGKPASYCGEEPSKKKFKSMNKKAVARITQIVKVDLDDPHAFREALAKGQDIWIAIKLTPTFVKVQGDEVPDFDAKDSMSGHAILLAGYRKKDGEYQYLLHNSWGKKWGDKGYAWIGEDTLFRNLQYAYLVDAEPTDDTGSGKSEKNSVGSGKKPKIFSRFGVALGSCDAGMVQDAATKSCVKACADGSPPVNGQCAASEGCETGVRVGGGCVQSAPARRGNDGKSGVSWTCGAGGCTYAIPKGTYGCKEATCTVSCAAPRFHLTHGEAGVGCIE